VVLYPDAVTGNGAEDPDVSGVWVYDDGFIEPEGQMNADVLGIPGLFYPAGDPRLGRFLDPVNVGTWRIVDYTLQTDTGGEGVISGATSLSWTRVMTGFVPDGMGFIDDVAGATELRTGTNLLVNDGPDVGQAYPWEQASFGFAGTTDDLEEHSFDDLLWGPVVEFGYQYTNFFDLVLGVAGFNSGTTYGRTTRKSIPLARRAYRDTFAFESTDPAAWPATTYFWSGNATDAGNNYLIYPSGSDTAGVDSQLGTREFFLLVDEAGPRVAANETIFNRLDFTAIETKFGGRSWYPLWGMGRMGFSFGGALTVMPYTHVSSVTYNASGDQTITDGLTTLNITNGQLLASTAIRNRDIWLSEGLYAAGDLEFGTGAIFVKSNLEYDYYFRTVHYGDIVENRVNLSGWSGHLALGGRF
jgi:hypothetical protein